MGTITRPDSMANAPQLMGDWSIVGKCGLTSIFAVISTLPKMKHTQQESFVVFFQYRP